MDFFGLSRLIVTLAAAACFSISAAEIPARKSPPPRIAPASPEAELAIRRFEVPPGFKVELFAAEPLLAHPVAFCVDEKNRFYVSESFRVGVQVTDIRGHMNWLNEELASTNTAQWRGLIEKYLKSDFMTAESERVSLLEDSDGDGKADKSTVFADGFNDLTSGIAAGVLARKGDVWFTCIPDLWRLRDQDGDGQAERRDVLQHGYGVRFGFYGHDLHGLRLGPDGKIYFSIGDRGFNVVTNEGKRVAAPESGAVLRCNPDGSDLEIFATGLRNPQELAFDQYGNLFTGDNNSDGGDQARWVYVVEGGDSGWRIGYQFLTWPVSRGPWNAEKMWHPQNEEQPAFLVPPLANLANGPSGLSFNPGVGLPVEYENHFFLADFRGTAATSLIHSFALKPKGAAFEVINLKPFLSQIVATDVDFGMDGSVYVADWVEGWGKTGKGRLYRMYHPKARSNPLVGATRALMAAGFERKPSPELAALLAWPDQRVRQEAQFELAARGTDSIKLLSEVAREGTNQLARVHAIWGLGQLHAQLGRTQPQAAESAVTPLVPLLNNPDAEIRAQSAKVLGDARYAPAFRPISNLVAQDKSPRVQFCAALAIGRIGDNRALKPILEMLRQNADRDPFLRHAGVMALFRINNPKALRSAGADESPAVRMAALLALRRLASPDVAKFLRDPEQRIVLEAARAIYDLPIESAMPALAGLTDQRGSSDALLRRVINANFRLGQAQSAAALAQLAADHSVSEAGRVEALKALGEWQQPPGRDRVTGLWRPRPVRNGTDAAEALRAVMKGLLAASSDAIQVEAARLAAKYRILEASAALSELVKSEKASPQARVEGLRALAALEHPLLPELLEFAGASRVEALSNEAAALLAKLNPAAGADRLAARLESGTLSEKQGALFTLAQLETGGSDQTLIVWLDKLLAGTVEAALQLDLLEAAAKRKTAAVQAKLNDFEASRPKHDLGKYVECLVGGDAAEGRKVFFEKAETSCTRCHKIGGEGGEAGPELDKTNANRTREYILESIVAPNKNIAQGFENLIVRLKDGGSFAGIVRSETSDELVLNSPEDGVIKVPKREIESRERGGSGMPEGLADFLSKRDLRNLVEFLANLRQVAASRVAE
ncbi:MAG: HEAT repeat domain-containing protein [Verrucomicrobia bacterium]|nr:HEAT repeat domain-containing protein [Verrucomicrobiota bacterium]